MKKIIFILSSFGYFLTSSAQRYTGYGRGVDRDGGFVFVTGDDAVSGIIMLLGCIITAFICYKLVNSIDRDEENKGVRKVIVYLLYVVITVSSIAAIGFAFALWWIMLILIIISSIIYAIYEKYSNKNLNSIKIESKTSEKENVSPTKTQIKQEDKNISHNSNINVDNVEIEKTVFVKDWKLLFFAKEFGPKAQVGTFVTSDNTKVKICIFTRTDGSKTYVIFFHELGELSAQEISNRKNELYVGKTKNGRYFLYSKENKGWILEKPVK